jgi:DNA polymerase I
MLDQFRAIWLIDFEFCQPPGERPKPICSVSREYRSGRTIRLWDDELRAPPFATGPDVLVVAYYSSAEFGCYQCLGWPLPERILDLFVEFRTLTNGLPTPHGRDLLGALTYFGLDAISAATKATMRSLAMRGGPYTASERLALINYCQSDVDSLAKLLPVMIPGIDLPRALLRGRYMVALAKIERAGVPIDVATYSRFFVHWERLVEFIIREFDVYGLYESTTFKLYRFKEWLWERDLAWPYLDTGNLDLDGDAFEMMAELAPVVIPIRELRDLLSQLRLPAGLTIGSDGRNRATLWAFASRTGRNQPSGAKFIFGPAAWLRGLIQPNPGRAVAYVDWSQQEFGIGAALSNDTAMMDAYASGDPYLAFGKQANIIPPDGTSETHSLERDRLKACVLGTQYGMGANTLARRIGQQPAHARELLELHRRTYPKYWRWSDQAEIAGMLGGVIYTVFGWPLHVAAGANPRSLRNFYCQANGAEMLRLACCLATERGVTVVAPVHDAILVEGAAPGCGTSTADDIGDVVAATQAAMCEASEIVLDGFALRSKAQIVHHPDRLLDAKTTLMWDRIVKILNEIDLIGKDG